MPGDKRDRKLREAKTIDVESSSESGRRSIKKKISISSLFAKKEVKEIDPADKWANKPLATLPKFSSTGIRSTASLNNKETSDVPQVPPIPGKYKEKTEERSRSAAMTSGHRKNSERERSTSSRSVGSTSSSINNALRVPVPIQGWPPGEEPPSDFQPKAVNAFDSRTRTEPEIRLIFETLLITMKRTLHFQDMSEHLFYDKNLPQQHSGDDSVVSQTHKSLLEEATNTAQALLRDLNQHELIMQYNKVAQDQGLDSFQAMASSESAQAQADRDQIMYKIAGTAIKPGPASEGKAAEGKRKEK